MELFEKALVVSGDGAAVLPLNGTVVAVVENGQLSYYDLAAVIENVITSCGRFMLDQSMLDEPPQAVRAAAGDTA